MPHTIGKLSTRSINFSLDLNSIKGLHTKLWGPKVVGVPTLGISRLPFGSFETKCHSDVGLVERHRVYCKGEGGGFPQVRAMVSLVNSNLPVTRPSTKSVMDRLQTSGKLQDKTSFIDPSTGVDLLKSCSPDYLLL
jgi:hypothetical protein